MPICEIVLPLLKSSFMITIPLVEISNFKFFLLPPNMVRYENLDMVQWPFSLKAS